MQIPIGVSNFKKLLQFRNSKNEPYFYVDKTLMIGDIIDEAAQVTLITRPRRFGKTLNLSMLQYFFAGVVNGETTEGLFEGLNISKHQAYMSYQGKFPVICITFKDLKHSTWDDMFQSIKQLIYTLYKEHEYLLLSPKISETDKKDFALLLDNPGMVTLQRSLKLLSELLFKHFEKRVIVLIDEYDTPIQSGYLNGFYKQVVELMRNMFSAALKDNAYLEKGVLTGITRVSRENLFSGLNHIKVCSILENAYSQYFGFTEEEVQNVCKDHMETIKYWYNGYQFGEKIIYNPWSVLNFIAADYKEGPYWVNTSDNAFIKDQMQTIHLKLMEQLIKREPIEAIVDIHLVFEDLDHDEDAFWSLLLMSGYLTIDSKYHLRIPNKEIEQFYIKMLKQWFSKKGERYFDDFLIALIEGNAEMLEEKLKTIFIQTLSFHDTAYSTRESFYHGLMLGFVIGLRDRYMIKSNRESGYGRYDIGMIPKDPKKYPGIIIECKYEKDAKAALQQLADRSYSAELRQHGCQKILLYGFAFDGKNIDVILATES